MRFKSDENSILVLSFIIYVLIQPHQLNLTFTLDHIQVKRRFNFHSLNLDVTELQLNNDCGNLFNPSFVENMVIYRCYFGERNINEAIYHIHKLQFNQALDNSSIISINNEHSNSFDMAYEHPLDAIEWRRGHSSGWSWIGAEDGRFIIIKNEYYVVYTAPSQKVQVDVMRGVFIMPLKDAIHNKYTAKEIKNEIGFTRSSEKHWAFLYNPVLDSTFVIYQLEPYTLGIMNSNHILFHHSTRQYTCLQSDNQLMSINIATNAIKIIQTKNMYLLMYHKKYNGYLPYVLLVDADYPHAPLMTSTHPLQFNIENEHFIFVNSLSTTAGKLEATRQDTLVVGLGLSDTAAAYAKVSVADILALHYTVCTVQDD